MAERDENSRALGGLVCLGTLLVGALFLYGLATRSYWALAIPVAVLLLFVLSLVFWIGWTVMTVEIDAQGAPLEPEVSGDSAGSSGQDSASDSGAQGSQDASGS